MRRAFSTLLSLMLVSAPVVASVEGQWRHFQHRFIASDGRVIDNANGGISHSEGQGIAMVFAALLDDRELFDRVWHWTRARLQIRDDHLFAWKWVPDAAEPVPDLNNASDGDILIAWGLYLAHQRWGREADRLAADHISADIRRLLIRPSPFGPLLLPGAHGFEHGGARVVNLSYWVFPAFETFARYGHRQQWQALAASGETLLRRARFGRWELPPDWLRIEGERLTVEGERHAPRFGYNAVRIPLYLIWAGRDGRTLLQPFERFWSESVRRQGRLPEWVDLLSDRLSPAPAPAAFGAIFDLVRQRLGQPPLFSSAAGERHYYPASLALMVALARRDSR